LISQENQGQLNTVRAGVEEAQGDIITLLDSDDILLPNYLDRLRQIYSEDPEVSFVFSAPEVFGDNKKQTTSIRKTMKKMAFPRGRIGPTKWATILFNEFVSTPTSGISMSKGLADKIMSAPANTSDTAIMSHVMQRLLGIPESEVKLRNISADGIIVRCASVLEVVKYYDNQPGFRYRIHGNNKWASMPRISRWYLRLSRAQHIKKTYQDTFNVTLRPRMEELYYEICNRSWSNYLPRQIRKRAEYFIATLISKGSLKMKLKTATAALGSH